MIIHISGFSGSGKTTLGEKIQKRFGSQVVVYDTDGFIQHHISTGKQLLQMEKQIDKGEKTLADYRALWKSILAQKIAAFVAHHPNKIIVFVGSLDNWAPANSIYKIAADYLFVLDVPLDELMKRYYRRLYLEDERRTAVKSREYWLNLADGTYFVSSSAEIIKNHQKYNDWHKRNHYVFLSDDQIMNRLTTIVSRKK